MRRLLSPRQRLAFTCGVVAWLILFVCLWAWWLQPLHNIGTLKLVFNSAILAWLTLPPLYFLAIFVRAEVTAEDQYVPDGLRVAMVVTKAPAEPFDLVRETLEAMLAQDVKHDTWLADEDPDDVTIKWCNANGVRISTRRGVTDYHRATWPRRTRCKEGNLAYFYDRHGYKNYDVVVQMDADHRPTPDYLGEMLRPFADPQVGYVSAPSICNRNAAESWAARSRLFVEGTFHGLMQAGYNAGWAPICIGSHYAVRTTALKQIGGLGPELAEDHSTTLIMNAHGWRGVHAMNAIAYGLGPATFSDFATQEFQWSRSLVTILLKYAPTYIPRLPGRLRFQFLFCQLWYPLLALFMLSMYVTPILALLMQDRFVNIQYGEFLVLFAALEALLCAMAFGWKRAGWCRPHDVRIVSWEGMLFVFAKWPWVLAGTLVALCDVITGARVDFRVTPKQHGGVPPLPWRVLTPYALLVLGSALPVMAIGHAGNADGFYVFASLNAAIYAALMITIVRGHIRENNVAMFATGSWAYPARAICASAICLLPLSAVALRAPEGIAALAWGTPWLDPTMTTYSVSGAGMRGHRHRRVRFRNPWANNTDRQPRVLPMPADADRSAPEPNPRSI